MIKHTLMVIIALCFCSACSTKVAYDSQRELEIVRSKMKGHIIKASEFTTGYWWGGKVSHYRCTQGVFYRFDLEGVTDDYKFAKICLIKKFEKQYKNDAGNAHTIRHIVSGPVNVKGSSDQYASIIKKYTICEGDLALWNTFIANSHTGRLSSIELLSPGQVIVYRGNGVFGGDPESINNKYNPSVKSFSTNYAKGYTLVDISDWVKTEINGDKSITLHVRPTDSGREEETFCDPEKVCIVLVNSLTSSGLIAVWS